jgi:hypothetical protein
MPAGRRGRTHSCWYCGSSGTGAGAGRRTLAASAADRRRAGRKWRRNGPLRGHGTLSSGCRIDHGRRHPASSNVDFSAAVHSRAMTSLQLHPEPLLHLRGIAEAVRLAAGASAPIASPSMRACRAVWAPRHGTMRNSLAAVAVVEKLLPAGRPVRRLACCNPPQAPGRGGERRSDQACATCRSTARRRMRSG